MTRLEFLKLLWPPIFLPMLFLSGKSMGWIPIEYRRTTILITDDMQAHLSMMGINGWQLCTRTDREIEIEFIFSRPLR